MREKLGKIMLLSIITLLISGMLPVSPVFSGFPPRSYTGPGTGKATFYVSPQDSNFTNAANGTWFPIQIRMSNFTLVYSWQYQLIFKTALLYTAFENITEVPGTDYVFYGKSRTALSISIDPYNGTYTRLLASVSLQGSTLPVNGTDKGVTDIWIKIIKAAAPGETLSTLLFFQTSGDGVSDDTWTIDYGGINENNCTMLDGYYQIESPPPARAYLELSPTSVVKPTIPGNRIVGTPDALFDVNMLINNVSSTDFLVLTQFNVTYDNALLTVDNVLEGTFMNNSVWAPYGTMLAWNLDPGMVTGFILIMPNGTGQFNMAQFPSGDGLLLTIRFRAISQPETATNFATTDLLLDGVFNEFFVSANDTYLPFNPPVSGTYTIYGFNWAPPTAQFAWTPSIPLINSPITFNASASRGYRNVDGVLVPDLTYIQEYRWSWGDGSPDNVTTTPIMTHTYTAIGNYDVNLTITDNDNRTSILIKTVAVSEMFNLEITTTTGGSTNPTPGGHLYFPMTNVTVTAIPSAGYYFSGWELDSVDVGTANPIIVTMDSSHTLLAVFSSIPPSPPILQVTADVGSLHFPGETAEFYVFVTFQGMPANATVKSFKLYFSGALLADLTGDLISTGLYRVRYNIPTTAAAGTYMLVVQVEYYSASANTLKSFIISQMLNARLTAIENGVATISTDMGVVKANLTDIKATITKIDGEVVFINSTLGQMKTTLSTINANVISIDDNVVTLQTDLGTVQTTIDDVQTAIGGLSATAQTILYVTSALSAIAAIAAILVLVLFLRKRK